MSVNHFQSPPGFLWNTGITLLLRVESFLSGNTIPPCPTKSDPLFFYPPPGIFPEIEIIHQALIGALPEHITLKSLKTGLPADWEEQKKFLRIE